MYNIWAALLFVYQVEILYIVCCMREMVGPFLGDVSLIAMMRSKLAPVMICAKYKCTLFRTVVYRLLWQFEEQEATQGS